MCYLFIEGNFAHETGAKENLKTAWRNYQRSSGSPTVSKLRPTLGTTQIEGQARKDGGQAVTM